MQVSSIMHSSHYSNSVQYKGPFINPRGINYQNKKFMFKFPATIFLHHKARWGVVERIQRPHLMLKVGGSNPDNHSISKNTTSSLETPEAPWGAGRHNHWIEWKGRGQTRKKNLPQTTFLTQIKKWWYYPNGYATMTKKDYSVWFMRSLNILGEHGPILCSCIFLRKALAILKVMKLDMVKSYFYHQNEGCSTSTVE